MKVEAIGEPFVYRWPGGEVRLEPGKPVELTSERAEKLLARAYGRVRAVEAAETVVIEPAANNARQVFWEQADGRILGPAVPEFLAKVGDGPRATFWIVVTHDGQPRWVRSDRLRSRRQFQTQLPVRTVEQIKEPR